MSNGLRRLQRAAKIAYGKRQQPIPGRSFIRSQGCWNCTKFNHEELYERRLLETGMRDIRHMVDEEGKTPMEAARAIAVRNKTLAERGAGICLGGGTQGDFVVARYLCNRWVGRVGVDKTKGGVDPLASELKDMLGDKS